MDISIIDATQTTLSDGLKIGSDAAPKKLVEFINLRCPYCKQWFQESAALLDAAVDKGQVQRIIKLLDKEKESLQPGNVMHRYIDQNHALSEIKKVFDTQAQWGHLSLDEVAGFAEEKLHLKKQASTENLKRIVDEAKAANIQFVPTIIVDQHIFDESVTSAELKAMLNL